jgi:16S rRNA (cytidine1402-2'-O)-methyltransferase
MGTLYVVSTPIGNLEDVTHRAARVLTEVDRVLAEDTRRTGKLLRHIGAGVRMTSLHAHNEASRRPRVLDWLEAGLNVALVSDAGTPLISDPGARIVQAALEAGHSVVPVPGPSAVLAALVASGLSAERFTFLGFLPRRGAERRRLLQRLSIAEETTVLFESPERLAALLADLEEACGGDRPAAVSRELTKLHETTVRGTISELRGYYESSAPRGEVTVVVAGALSRARQPELEREQSDQDTARALAKSLLESGEAPSSAARELARRLDVPRNLAYQIVQEAKDA